MALAYEYDPYFSLSIARVDPLPHQLEAVYDYFLKLPRIRFLLADDPGAGKTIMAGLLIKELKIRGLVKRTLIVTPANLSFQWQREMKDKFRENFEVIRSDVLRANYGSNPWQEKNQVITSVSWVSRIEDAKESLLRSHWDLIIVDEAHKMSAASRDKKTLAYQLGEALSAMTDHYLLMTATPHKGDPENFCLFLELLDRDVYGDVKSLEEAMQQHEAPFYLRRVKEALVTFPDPDTGKVKTLFTKRNVQTTEFQIDGRGVGLLRRPHPLRRGPVHQGRLGRLRPRPGARLHDGHAPAPLRLQHLRRPPQPGAHEGQAREDPGRPRRLPPGADQQTPARGLRRPARRRAAGNHRRAGGRGRLRTIRPRSGRKSSNSASSSTRPGSSNNREVESKLVKLREVLTEHGIFKDPKMKLLIFTEHKDTLDYLVGDGKDGRPLGKLRRVGPVRHPDPRRHEDRRPRHTRHPHLRRARVPRGPPRCWSPPRPPAKASTSSSAGS